MGLEIYITTWALTKGILKVVPQNLLDNGFAKIAHPNRAYESVIVSPKEWFFSETLAMQQAQNMQKLKINDLKNKLNILEKLDFEYNVEAAN